MATYGLSLFSTLLFFISANIDFIKCSTDSDNYYYYEKKLLDDFCEFSRDSKSSPKQMRKSNISTGLILRAELDYFSYEYTKNLHIDCSFTIKAPEGYGLFASVEHMSIGEDEGDNQTCQNYIRFTEKRFTSYRELQKKHCKNYTYKTFNPVGVYDPKGEITIDLFIKPKKKNSPYRKFLIVFTVVKTCQEDDAVNDFKNIPSSSICMKEAYICDKIHNCHGRLNCEDEGQSCEQKPEASFSQHRKNRGTTIISYIFRGFIVIMSIFFLCFWIYRCMVFCLSNQSTHSTSEAVAPNVATTIQLNENIVITLPSTYNNLSFDRGSPKEEEPPSYESLFQSQATANATSSN